MAENLSARVLMLVFGPEDVPLLSRGYQKSMVEDTLIAHVLGERATVEFDDEGSLGSSSGVAAGLPSNLMSQCKLTEHRFSRN